MSTCEVCREAVLCREELEFIANTLIFVLSGVVIAGRIYESANSSEKLIEPSDWGYTLLLWVYLTVRSNRHPVICDRLASPTVPVS